MFFFQRRHGSGKRRSPIGVNNNKYVPSIFSASATTKVSIGGRFTYQSTSGWLLRRLRTVSSRQSLGWRAASSFRIKTTTMPLRSIFFLVAIILAVPVAAKPRATITTNTPLDTYVSTPDPAFAWRVVHRVERTTHRELIVELTSQTWRSSDEVNRTKWQHGLALVVPKNVTSDVALLLITGGSNPEKAPTAAADQIRHIALATQTVTAELRQVPNQPLQIFDSSDPQRQRHEDDLLTASWKRFMATKDPTWIAQLPMAKSAVAAMDAVQQSLAKEDNAPKIKRFVVAGASKRGWTTWLAAAVDDRVAAIAPLVIDMLNIKPSMKHHRASYGFWAEALNDYEREGFTKLLPSSESEAIRGIVDPYVYRDRLTMPKCLISASGDEFFLPDSSRFYFDDLVGEKYLSYTPNSGHSLDRSDALDTLLSFHASVAHGLPRPTVTWNGDEDAKEHIVRCSTKPVEAILWRAVNCDARDFRHTIVGDAYKATPLEPDVDGVYHMAIETPEKGFSATFARFAFDIGTPKPFRISTPVWISPNIEPFAER